MSTFFPKLLVLTFIVTAPCACSVKPWVKPFERERVADPIMSFDRHPTLGGYRTRVHEITEGAKGATGTAGTGCGCN